MNFENTFQTSLIKYAGFTGSTGGMVIPMIVSPSASGIGIKLAGYAAIDSSVTQIDIPVPLSARTIVVMARDLDLTAANSIGIYIVSVANSFGVDIAPPTDTNNQQVLCQSYSADGATWVGAMNVGKINGLTEGKTEMLAGKLLSPLQGVTIAAVGGGDLTDGEVWVLYQ